MMPNQSTFIEWLEDHLDKTGMSQAEFGRRIGLPPYQVPACSLAKAGGRLSLSGRSRKLSTRHHPAPITLAPAPRDYQRI